LKTVNHHKLLYKNENDLGVKLPKVVRYKHRNPRDGSDSYGALDIAAKYCGIYKPLTEFKSLWQHGCQPPWWHVPEIHVYHRKPLDCDRFFVARDDEKELLHKAGYSNVYSIGLPYVYLPEIKQKKKRKNSLLVMPIHTIGSVPFNSEQQINNYVDFIVRQSKDFKDVVVCLHRGCIEHGYWIEEFNDKNIKCILGADPNDKNALMRIKSLVSTFEYMTTNDWGSHVAYALSDGSKVSVCGPCPERDMKTLLQNKGWQNNTRGYKEIYSESADNEMSNILNKIYCNPIDGVADIELGRYLIGKSNKKLKHELKKIFNWDSVWLDCLYKLDVTYGFVLNGIEMYIKGLIPNSIRYAIYRK